MPNRAASNFEHVLGKKSHSHSGCNGKPLFSIWGASPFWMYGKIKRAVKVAGTVNWGTKSSSEKG